MSEETQFKAKVVAAFAVIYIVWGTTFLAIRIAVETIPPFMTAGLRFFLAGGVMLPILLAQGGRFPSLIHWRSAVIAGGLMLAGGIGLLTYSETRIPSGLAALMVTTIPIWMTLLGWLGFGGKRPGAQTFVGLGLGFAGAAGLFAPALGSATGDYDLVGMGIVLIGAFIFALGSVYSRRAPMPEDTAIGTASEMLAGGTLLLLISVIVGEPGRTDFGAISTRAILALAYLIVFGSILGYTAFLWLMKNVDPAKAGTNFYVNPVVAVVAGWLLADETVTLPMIIAAAVILIGVAVINTTLPRRGATRQRETAITLEGGAAE
jgi:drug/metabolite transporter (DMT)-like permease